MQLYEGAGEVFAGGPGGHVLRAGDLRRITPKALQAALYALKSSSGYRVNRHAFFTSPNGNIDAIG
jgi:hypothetical protein